MDHLSVDLTITCPNAHPRSPPRAQDIIGYAHRFSVTTVYRRPPTAWYNQCICRPLINRQKRWFSSQNQLTFFEYLLSRLHLSIYLSHILTIWLSLLDHGCKWPHSFFSGTTQTSTISDITIAFVIENWVVNVFFSSLPDLWFKNCEVCQLSLPNF